MKLNQLLVTLASIAGAASLNLKVSNTGGNNTSPLLYGLLYEVPYTFTDHQLLPANDVLGCLSLWRWRNLWRDDPE